MKRTIFPALALCAGVTAQAQYSAWLPAEQQFVVTPGFTYSRFDEFWMGNEKVDNPPNGKRLHQYVSYVGLEYGILENLAADVTVGYTWTESKAFNATGRETGDRGIADTYAGLRYQVFDETKHEKCWGPTIAFRLGAVIPGTYDEDFPFSAGDGAAAVEGSVLLAREICPGFGLFGDAGYRIREGDVPDDFFGAGGVYGSVKGFTASVAYRHIQSTSGPDIGDPGFGTEFGFPEVREVSQNVEFGLGYTCPKTGVHVQGFFARTLDGRNTGARKIFGGSVSIPFGGK